MIAEHVRSDVSGLVAAMDDYYNTPQIYYDRPSARASPMTPNRLTATVMIAVVVTLGFFAGLHYAGMAEPYRELSAVLGSE